MQEVHQYFIINKPVGMLSQFVCQMEATLLGELDFPFPEGIHAIGRLDKNSEGLLILTTNKRVTKLLFQGEVPHQRIYLVLVRYAVSQESLDKLRNGVVIKIENDTDYTTPPCNVQIITDTAPFGVIAEPLPDYMEATWLTIELAEGKYHQVRKMVRAAGHPCKRLVRVSIEDLKLLGIPTGGVKEIEEEAFFKALKIDNWRTIH
jgi:23S rRNA pseudouridine2457 synthase